MKKLVSVSASLLFFAALLTTSACNKDEDCQPSTKNTELTQKMFGYFTSGDIASFLNNCDPACTFDITGNQILNPGKVYNGTEGFMVFLSDLSAKGQPTEITPIDFYESGDVVTVQGKLTFTDFATNQTCKVNFVQLWKYSGDKLVYFKEDHDHRECN